MVFYADDRVLIKVLRQEKGCGAKNSSQNFPASQIWGKLQERVYRNRIRWPAEVVPDRRVGTFPPGVHRWIDQAVASPSSSLHSSTRRTFWIQTLVMFDICTNATVVHVDNAHSVPRRRAWFWSAISNFSNWVLYGPRKNRENAVILRSGIWKWK